jgi:hypothetical protein
MAKILSVQGMQKRPEARRAPCISFITSLGSICC